MRSSASRPPPMTLDQLATVVHRIETGLNTALDVLKEFPPETVEVRYKQGDDPVTQADRDVDTALRTSLPQTGEGWLSEETTDDARRLQCAKVWVVDPLDGTREFVSNIPEWCVSIGYVVDGEAVAGGILNPSTGDRFVGAVGLGMFVNGLRVEASTRSSLRGGCVPASRSEIRRGEWRRFEGLGFEILPTGSSAYKLALVASGRAEASWTLTPKNEWDVAAGVALVRASGGIVYTTEGLPRRFNAANPLLPGLIAAAPGVAASVAELLGIGPRTASTQ